MGRKNRQSGGLRSEYLRLSIIPTTSNAKRSSPWMVAGALIAVGMALIFVFTR
jgi:hypothetical protein